MKVFNCIIRLVICLVLSSLFIPRVSAQKVDETKNLLSEKLKSIDKEGRPSEQSWRGNRQDFFIHKGVLSLATTNRFGRRLLFTKVMLGQAITWSGSVRMDAPPTNKNYAYILLADLPQYHSEKSGIRTFEYLALSIGGRGRKDIALVTLRLNAKGENIQTAAITLERDVNLITSPQLEFIKNLNFNYRVSYDYNKGKLSLSLDFPDKANQQSDLGTIDWRELLPQNKKHSFGFLVNFTKTYQNAFHFSNLCISNSSTTDNTGKSEDKPNNQGDKNKGNGDNNEKSEDKPVLITEVMPNPKPTCAEYLELYNLNDRAIDLSAYQIGIGSSEAKVRKVSLRSAGSIGAKSYLVLSTNPQAVLDTYPSCPKNITAEVNLPQMNNKGCYIFLYKNGQMIDGLHYNPKNLPTGFQSKKGIALQRSSLEHKELMTDIPWHIGTKEAEFATAGLPNSPAPSESDLPNRGNKDKGKTKNKEDGAVKIVEIQQRLREDANLVVQVRIYDLMGALLYEAKSSEARAYVSSYFTKDGSSRLRNSLPKQTLISQIILSDPKGKSPREILTNLFYPY